MAVNLTTSYQLIASKNTSTYSTLRLYGRIYETDDANLRTRIQLQARLYGNGGSGSFGSGSCVLTGDGQSQTQSLGSTSYTKGKEMTLATKTFWIEHNGSGEAKNKSVSSALTTTGTPNGTASGTINLPSLSTTSTISISGNILIGTSNTLNITNYDDTYKNTITYTLGSSTGTIVTDYVGKTLYWTPPISLIDELTSTQKTKDGTLTITTKKADGTPVGSKTQTFTFEVGTSVFFLNVDAKETNLDVITALGTDNMQKAIIGLSKPRIQAEISATRNAQIKRVLVSCGSLNDPIDLTSSPTSPYNLDYTFENPMEDSTITIYATDTREIQGSAKIEPTSYETYTPIVLTSKSIERGDIQDGEVIVSYEGTSQPNNIDGVTSNNINFSYRYKENSESASFSPLYDIPSGTDPQESDYNPSYSYDTTTGEWSLTNYTIDTLDFTADYNKSYIIEMYIYDNCTPNSPLKYQDTINKAVPSMSLGENDLQVNGDLFVADEDGNNPRNVLEDIGDLSQLATTDKSSLVDAINELSGGVDTGWKNMTLNSGVSTGSLGGRPQYRKIGNQVYVRGGFAFTKGSGSIDFATLPAGYRPPENMYVMNAVGGTRIARTYIASDGRVGCDWIYNLNGTTAYTGNVAWCQLTATYIVD